jgi:NitT/TauT family transport system ATP-binding protein
MHQLLQRIWLRDRKTVVFVTHDVREALVLGDRVIVMGARPGRVLRDLDVRLPRPRDPDDEALVELSRRIRDELRGADGGAAPRGDPAKEADDAPVAASGGARDRAAPDLGAPG